MGWSLAFARCGCSSVAPQLRTAGLAPCRKCDFRGWTDYAVGALGGPVGLGAADIKNNPDQVGGFLKDVGLNGASSSDQAKMNNLNAVGQQGMNFAGQAQGGFNQLGAQGMGALNALNATANGQNSVSAEQLRQGQQANMAQQQSLAAAASPQNAAMAARQAAQNISRLNYGLSGQQATAGLQERQQAQQAYAGLLGTLRGQDLQGTLGGYNAANQAYTGGLNGVRDPTLVQQWGGAISAGAGAFRNAGWCKVDGRSGSDRSERRADSAGHDVVVGSGLMARDARRGPPGADRRDDVTRPGDATWARDSHGRARRCRELAGATRGPPAAARRGRWARNASADRSGGCRAGGDTWRWTRRRSPGARGAARTSADAIGVGAWQSACVSSPARRSGGGTIDDGHFVPNAVAPIGPPPIGPQAPHLGDILGQVTTEATPALPSSPGEPRADRHPEHRRRRAAHRAIQVQRRRAREDGRR